MPKVTHFLVHSPLHTHTHARYGESESLTFPFKFVPPLLNKKKMIPSVSLREGGFSHLYLLLAEAIGVV